METIIMIETIIVALITAVIGPIVVAWVKLKLEKKETQTPVREALETSNLIEDQLDIIMEELNCDRIWIAQFHNGGHFYPTGKSIQKFSFFHEKTSPNTIQISNTHSKISQYLYSLEY
jgi:hypothetical protein